MSLKEFKKDLIDMAKLFLPAIIIAWLITTYLIANAVVPSGSMETTIMTNSRLIGNRLAYKFGEKPERGDIIIFRYPDDESLYFVKRLIGLPGDTVEIIPNDSDDGYGYVKINGERVNEPYLNEQMEVTEYLKFNVPEKSYFFLGDNRNHSNDARYWDTTYVAEEKLVAKVLFQYWKGFKAFRTEETT